MNVLEAKDLSFAYGNTPVLDAASFTMCEGGFAALVSLSKNTPPKAFATAKAFGIIEENHLGRPPHGKARRRRPPQSNGY